MLYEVITIAFPVAGHGPILYTGRSIPDGNSMAIWPSSPPFRLNWRGRRIARLLRRCWGSSSSKRPTPE